MTPKEGDSVSKPGRRTYSRGSRLYHLFMSTVAALVFWTLFSLSQDYSVFLDYGLVIRTNIQGRENSALADDKLMVRAKASGFYIISHRSGLTDASIVLDIDRTHLIHQDVSSDIFQVNLQDMLNEVVSAFGPDVTVETVVSGNINVPIHKVAVKKVPVILSYSLKCEPQYEMTGEPVVTPDSVLISGNAVLVASVSSVHSENLSIKGVSSDVQGMVDIHTPKGISVSVPGVVYSLKVERYVEESVTLPVTVCNVPSGRKVIVLPDEVKVVCRHVFPFSGKKDLSGVTCFLDYEKLVRSETSDVIPEVSFPSGMEMFLTELHPSVVQFVILER